MLKEVLRYKAVYITSFFLNGVILYALVDIYSLNALSAQLFGTICVAIFNFISLKTIVFK